MDNQNQPPVQNPAVPVQPPMAAAAPMPQPQPSAAGPSSSAVPPQSPRGRKFLFIIVAVVLLLIAVGAYYYFAMSTNNTNLSAYPTVIPTVTKPLETPVPTVNPIESSADLDGVLSQLDGTDTSATAELDQNSSDSTTFTP